MATEVKMPQLSDTMDSGKILSWLKKEGDTISRGDMLAEVETDKANLQIESFQQGVLLKIVTPVGSAAKVGDVIALVGAAGEAVSTSTSTASKPSSEPVTASQPAAPAAQPTTSQKIEVSSPAASSGERIKASPLARKIAEQKNIDLSAVTGSGPNGRIIKKDLEVSSSTSQSSAAPELHSKPTPTAVPQTTIAGQGKLTPLSKMRETIARRMQESVTTAPHFYVTTSINMKEANRLRETLKEKGEFKGISINHLVIKAAAYALKKEPKVNCAMKDGQLFSPAHINIGIITAIEDGLLIPVIKDTDTLSLKDLVFEARAAVERARAGRPSSSDLSGGTFSISNMGMFDVENFTAIINPGQGGILAVSSTKETPIVENGQITIGSIMKVTLSVDHRIIDGVMAGTFLKAFKEALETPALMLL